MLIVVSGGPGTLDTIDRALAGDRPCVVLAESGGVATDLYTYSKKHGFPRSLAGSGSNGDDAGLPALSGKLNASGLPTNQAYVDKCRELFPKILSKGSQIKGANQSNMLKFFRYRIDSQELETEGADSAQDLEAVILEAILSDIDDTVGRHLGR